MTALDRDMFFIIGVKFAGGKIYPWEELKNKRQDSKNVPKVMFSRNMSFEKDKKPSAVGIQSRR